jgi:hypothetical protein
MKNRTTVAAARERRTIAICLVLSEPPVTVLSPVNRILPAVSR